MKSDKYVLNAFRVHHFIEIRCCIRIALFSPTMELNSLQARTAVSLHPSAFSCLKWRQHQPPRSWRRVLGRWYGNTDLIMAQSIGKVIWQHRLDHGAEYWVGNMTTPTWSWSILAVMGKTDDERATRPYLTPDHNEADRRLLTTYVWTASMDVPLPLSIHTWLVVYLF